MISIEEILEILIVAVILFGGSKKIPELARSLGRASGEFQRGKMEIEREIRNAINYTPQQQATVNVREAARNLGISVDGKSDDQLRSEIAQVLGVKKE
ncbi:twin-arginine translocase TatA/TatE family subunit [Thermogymnomonas acidicola]|uniref:Twin-arginine translocase TatA/TatE family subunit n=1 Tax=Thermogymnomonas acidicola TaxID=399579 RepID=A0AA37BRX1_9ARCH|nr:twin-arginine translocase TatA/TatE family subunit [Thermogymnomonas acidicola]GGM75528.1 twin-arginine translocase TatA/TatE family subunit [Thermogymnomonas acidicola]